MKKVHQLLLLLAVIITATSCQDKYPDLKDGIYAEIETTKGTMVAELYYDKAPMTVGNFVALAEGKHPKVADSLKGKPFYNGLIFHRVIPDFMIQGGDITGTGSGDIGYKFPQEVSVDLKHDAPGVLSMANAGPDTNGSQFFIMHKENAQLDMQYNVFGKVLMNVQVVDSIVNTPVNGQKPVEDMIMKKITIIRKGDAAKKWDAVKAFNDGVAAFDKMVAEKEAMMKKAAAAKQPQMMAMKSMATSLPSGVSIHVIKKGSGEKPKSGDIVGLMYSGYLEDGTLFGSNDKEATTAYGKFDPAMDAAGGYGFKPLQISDEMQMIPGFKDAVLNMGYGDKIIAFIPSALAYGEQGGGNVIPPNADLIFELEMSPKE
ncbi:MAG: peptidylprolyl isomerase [Nonlabens sp.]|nr:peptidylprolyl isomerase [Nonlabens sp.]MDP5101038.1 peptidylprolyl isomerase [Nonlabens sp.]